MFNKEVERLIKDYAANKYGCNAWVFVIGFDSYTEISIYSTTGEELETFRI